MSGGNGAGGWTRLPVTPWYHDLCSCLQVDVGCVLRHLGHPLVQALGAGWWFGFRPGVWEPVEFFCPTPDGNLASALAPHHPIALEWHQPADERDAEEQVIDALGRGVPPIVAVDNYHLPFRPAYHDVHAGHLVIVRGYDPAAREFDVLDPMPPAYEGPLPAEVLARARASDNPDDGSDPFFAGSGPRRRWLEVTSHGSAPTLTWEWLSGVLRANVRDLRDGGVAEDGYHRGLSGLRAYVGTLEERLSGEGDPSVLQEAYVMGWPLQASAALHAMFLADAGRSLERLDLVAAGRWVGLVAHSWTAFRVIGARGAAEPATGRALADAGWRLARHWAHALDAVESVLEEDEMRLAGVSDG